MNRIQYILKQPINKTLRVWHLVTLMFIAWILPVFLPNSFIHQWALFLIAGWLVLMVVISRTMKAALRKTTADVILIERFMLFASFMLPTILSIIYGVRNGFDTLLTASTVLFLCISAALLVGIVLHLKNTKDFYHGVKKKDLFK